MRKMARASIMLMAVGVILIPEAYTAHTGSSSSYGIISRQFPYNSPTFFLWRGQTLQGSVTANATLNLYIMDETNYLAFTEGKSWRPLFSMLDISNESLRFEVPTTGYYRIVVEVKSPREIAHRSFYVEYYGIDRDHFDSGLAFLLAGAVLGIIVLLSVLRSRSSTKKRASRE